MANALYLVELALFKKAFSNEKLLLIYEFGEIGEYLDFLDADVIKVQAVLIFFHCLHKEGQEVPCKKLVGEEKVRCEEHFP